MPSNIAVFLDLDNMLIGANEAGFVFDVEIILEQVMAFTNGRIVHRQAYGDWRTHQSQIKELTRLGFDIQAVVPLHSGQKNLADIQMVADACEVLYTSTHITDFVLITGDRDFVPLIGKVQKFGRIAIGCGVRHTTSSHFAALCDQFIYYDDLAEKHDHLSDDELREWIQNAADLAFRDQVRVQASVFRNIVEDVSNGHFGELIQGRIGFGRLLQRFSDIVRVEQEGTILYVFPFDITSINELVGLSSKYKTAMKKRGLRIVPAEMRLAILHDIVNALQQRQPQPIGWNELIEDLHEWYEEQENTVSKTVLSDVLRVARKARVISLPSNKEGALGDAPVNLAVDSFPHAVLACDAYYLNEIQRLDGMPFDAHEASIALYGTLDQAWWITYVLNRRDTIFR